MPDRAKRPPGEALVDLRRRLSLLPPRDAGRTEIIGRAAHAYGISVPTMYRALRELSRPKSIRRADHGRTRVAPQAEMERYAEIVAAMKLRTLNGKGRHLSTAEVIRHLEETGVETPDGLVRAPPGLLKRATIDRLLRATGLDLARATRPTAAVRFQARRSNELWHFDMSPSDLKQVATPLWVEEGRGKPTLMLFSVVDDRSGATYQEYRCVYGENAEAALRFLFNAMSAKPEPELPIQGIPATLHMDKGPVSRSAVFQSVMGSLGVRVLTHSPPDPQERRTAARAKGKVERPFRTIKEVHETLYHFHKPKDEEEANLWLRRALVTYNNGGHRSEPHPRIEDWLRHLPTDGVRAMCSWERFCAFAREPERRTVAGDATVSVEGASYEVEPELAGETVTLLWGLFDQELFVEHDGKRFGPFQPSRGAVPLYRYRKYQKSKAEERLDKVVRLADQLGLPRAAVTGGDRPLPSLPLSARDLAVRTRPFPEPVVEKAHPTALAARQAIAAQLCRPLGSLPEEDRRFIVELLSETLDKITVADRVRERLQTRRREG
ncbi:DDE-type integrase/transposase/recombinase [Sphingomonas aracearum]|uniref:Transposase n=1 Tax=Sphingomonas aracearum TaxID=2283317 RepID=A0A369VR30_9SPHN|nr:DDE-type integrase/transposase/recombinase [Sphingomonas aracearum]RDE04483.1 transposase [Sphingomonas aracearum]